MKRNLSILFILAAVLSPAAITQAAPPPTYLNYQGYLAAASDTLPYTGTADFVVRICDSPSAGSVLWEETHAAVSVTKGFYNIVLGQAEPIDPEMMKAYDLYLEVVIDGEALAPRKLLTSVARSSWSYLAEQATNATNATTATNAANATNAGHAARADSSQHSIAADLAGHSYTSYFADSSRYCDTAAYARASAGTPHNHLAESWSGTGNGLTLKISTTTASAVYGFVDTLYNGGNGSVYGGLSNVYGNSASGLRCGYKTIADNGSSGPAYGGSFETNGSSSGSGERRGVNAYAYLFNNGGPVYGVKSWATTNATNYAGLVYGGHFWAEGGNGSATKYGVYATASGSGTNYAGYFEGNLTVTGRLNVGASYTPSSSADASGAVGDITYDASYMYIKTASGWRRAALGSW